MLKHVKRFINLVGNLVVGFVALIVMAVIVIIVAVAAAFVAIAGLGAVCRKRTPR
jgi:hypothetical protein